MIDSYAASVLEEADRSQQSSKHSPRTTPESDSFAPAVSLLPRDFCHCYASLFRLSRRLSQQRTHTLLGTAKRSMHSNSFTTLMRFMTVLFQIERTYCANLFGSLFHCSSHVSAESGGVVVAQQRGGVCNLLHRAENLQLAGRRAAHTPPFCLLC